jgi:hypothetical protein
MFGEIYKKRASESHQRPLERVATPLSFFRSEDKCSKNIVEWEKLRM